VKTFLTKQTIDRRCRLGLLCVGVLVFAATIPQVDAARPRPEAASAFVATDTRLWTEPTRFGEAMALLKTGVELDVIEYNSNRDWMRVKTPSGRTGWILVRFTTQAGRRTFPINAALPEASQQEESEGGRGPASVELSATGNGRDSSGTWEGLLGLQYMNQITRESTSGFGFDLSALHRLTNNWSVGGAFTWDRFSKSASAGDFTTSRSSHRYFPHVLFRFRWADFRSDFGLGYALDRSSITTRDSSGQVITTAPDGGLVTGSGSESSLGLRITPRYILPLSRLVKVGFYMSYLVDIPLSSAEGRFAGADKAITPPFSYLGAGASVSIDF
jgi:hypothetical protein